MSVLFSGSLFFLSFFPLWFSIAFIEAKSIYDNSSNLYTEWIALTCIILGILICGAIVIKSLSKKNTNGAIEFTVVAAEEEKTISADYLLSYILPLFAFDFTQWDGIILFLVFFGTMGFLCVYHSHFSLNVLLEFAGYKFYKTDIMNADKKVVTVEIVSRENIVVKHNQEVSLRFLNNNYCCLVSGKA